MVDVADDVIRLAQIVRQRRHEFGITQEVFSLMTGISVRSLSDFENGNGGISLDRFLLITKTLGLPFDVVSRHG
jgi:transcriptional regulator with XRE-family HTH domain